MRAAAVAFPRRHAARGWAPGKSALQTWHTLTTAPHALCCCLPCTLRCRYSEDVWSGLYSFDTGCPEEGNPGRDLCMGMMGVYRVSWALFTFFLVMALFTFLAKVGAA